MRLTFTTVAVLYIFFSLSPTALGNSEIEVRGGKGDGHAKDNSPCFPFIFENNDCVRGRCKDSQKCELGFSLDPIRLCCVRQRYRRGDDEYGNNGSVHGGHGENCGCDKHSHGGGNENNGVYDGGEGEKNGHNGKKGKDGQNGKKNGDKGGYGEKGNGHGYDGGYGGGGKSGKGSHDGY
ncbi:hypothetical protein C8F04DRAFT_328926 [Mycena alexandri]|uniref:Uncharacterized protein n=1 Tax=Mycena alexandri TaxID=1745969 RepID=A0AAD6WME8_9AGAR|nr:hypothetical protein C8F04DRAFT_328926 [Mycena alexandri]